MPGFAAHIVPENVTLLPKTQPNPDSGEHTFTAKKGENVGSILHELGVPPDKIRQVLTVLGTSVRDGVLKEGEKVRVLLTTDALGRVVPLRVIVSGDDRAIETAVALSDMGSYVPVDIQNVDTIADTGANKRLRTRAPAYRSTKASGKRRCITRCRNPSSRNWSASTPTMSTSNARFSRATRSTCSMPRTPTATAPTKCAMRR